MFALVYISPFTSVCQLRHARFSGTSLPRLSAAPPFFLTRLKEILSVWGESSGRIGIGPKKSLKRVKKRGGRGREGGVGRGGASAVGLAGVGLVGRGVPVGAGAHLDLEGHAEGRRASHALAHDGREHVELAGGYLEDELVVNLQQQT